MSEIVGVVITLAGVIQTMANDANANGSFLKALAARVGLVPRVLQKYPNPERLDQELMQRLFKELTKAHNLITSFCNSSKIMRTLSSSSWKGKFERIDQKIGKSLDDLSLCINIDSAVGIAGIKIDLQTTITSATINMPEAVNILKQEYLIDYNTIEFEVKRGVRKELAIGKFNRIYAAKWISKANSNGLPQSVVIKEPNLAGESCSLSDEEWVDMLRSLSALNCINICVVYGGGVNFQDDDSSLVSQHFIALEFVSGLSLTNLLLNQPNQRFSIENALKIGYGIISGLEYIQAQYQSSIGGSSTSISYQVHGSLFPHHIIVDSNMIPKLIDVGLHKQYLAKSLNSVEFLGEDMQWLSPDQVRSGEATIYSDVYSFGLLLKLLIFSQKPYSTIAREPLSGYAIQEMILSGARPTLPTAGSHAADAFFIDVIASCINLNPGSRPQAGAVAKALFASCIQWNADISYSESYKTYAESKVKNATVAVKDDNVLDWNKFISKNTKDSNQNPNDVIEDPNQIGDFGEMSQSIEQLGHSISLFNAISPSNANIVVYGSKLILTNFIVSSQSCLSANKDVLMDEDDGAKMITTGISSLPMEPTIGTVVFHIDRTTSMSRERRMELTRQVLLRVIPKYIQRGFRVILNAWASNNINRGKMETINIDVPQEILQAATSTNENGDSSMNPIAEYINDNFFHILKPDGRTDLYGALYQLLEQCKRLNSSESPVFAFVLTDGIHNHVSPPAHHPSGLNEDYFKLYKSEIMECSSASSKYRWVRTSLKPEQFTEEMGSKTLKNVLNNLQMEFSAHPNSSFHLTLIGIGEAETKDLSNMANYFGDSTGFFGITQVDQSDSVFESSLVSSAVNSKLQLIIPLNDSKVTLDFTYTVEEDSIQSEESITNKIINGCLTINDSILLETIHMSTNTLSITYSNGNICCDMEKASSLISEPSTSVTKAIIQTNLLSDLEASVGELSSVIRRIRSTVYEIDTKVSNSFVRVFQQLLKDRQVLHNLKAQFFSKSNRYKRKYIAYSSMKFWIREMEDLLDSQITSFRMNIEVDMFNQLMHSGEADSSNIKEYIQPMKNVLERLQINLHNSGKPVHRVTRFLTAITTIRNRTFRITGDLFGSTLTISPIQSEASSDLCGVSLNVEGAGAGKLFPKVVEWKTSDLNHDHLTKILYSLQTNPILSVFNNNTLLGTSHLSKLEAPLLSFPCILLYGMFDSLAIIRAPQSFSTINIFQIQSQNNISITPLFCAEDIWELCHSCNFCPGEKLPVSVETVLSTAYSSAEKSISDVEGLRSVPNMILPLAHTPLLFALYVQRGRCFHSGINVTGDCMSLTPVALQWGKFFQDSLFMACSNPYVTSKKLDQLASPSAWIDLALKSVVSFSYAIEQSIAVSSLGKNATTDDNFTFGLSLNIRSLTNANHEKKSLSVSNQANKEEVVVISRDSLFGGLTCPLAVSKLIACGSEEFARDPQSWNVVVRTIFSRMAEAISGTKNIRHSTGQDLRELEDAYRLHVYALQKAVHKRLHIEWGKCSIAEKLSLIESNISEIRILLSDISSKFLSKFLEYRLQSWKSVMEMLQFSLLIHNYGMDKLKNDMIKCNPLDELIKQIDYKQTEAFNLPLICKDNNTGRLYIREMDDHDVDQFRLLIDAIVLTQVSPKVEYQPIVPNPTFPAISKLKNREMDCNATLNRWDQSLPVVNIAFMGNVNAGKSSIAGRLLENLQIVSPNIVDIMGMEAQKLGHKDAVKHAWIMDTTPEERSGGYTIHSIWRGFQTEYRRFNIVDNPGHKDFNANSSLGIYHGDVCLLITSAVMADIELAEMASTRSSSEEHLLTSFCYGARRVIVAVNKMDLVNYSQDAYDQVRQHTIIKAKRAGFKAENVVFVPVSVIDNINITTNGSFDNLLRGEEGENRMPWYKNGPCLLQVLDEIQFPPRNISQSFRLVISQTFKHNHHGSLVVCGKVDCGKVRVGDILTMSPPLPAVRGIVPLLQIESIQAHSQIKLDEANAGDDIGLSVTISHPSLHGVKGKDNRDYDDKAIQRGCVLQLASAIQSVLTMKKFEVQMLIGKSKIDQHR
eukprot:gene7755-10536_t